MSRRYRLTYSPEIRALVESLPAEQRQDVSRSFTLLMRDPISHAVIHIAMRNTVENRYAAYLMPGFTLEAEYTVSGCDLHVVKWTTRYPLIVFDADHRVVVPPVVAHEAAATVGDCSSPEGRRLRGEWCLRARTQVLDFRDLPDAERATALYTMAHSLGSRVKQAVGHPELIETASHERLAQANYGLTAHLHKAARLAEQQANGAYEPLHRRLGTMPWEEPEYIARMAERYS